MTPHTENSHSILVTPTMKLLVVHLIGVVEENEEDELRLGQKDALPPQSA